jgi:4-hydroxybenzoate polyprenyltransferase
MKETIRAYTRLTRFHTVPLEMVPATVGAVVATGGLFNRQVLPWVVFGALYHLVVYGQNSLEDWRRGWDKDDPNKQHHPLNAGMMSQREASLFVYGLFALTVGYTVAIAGNWLAIALFLTGLPITGSLYNIVGKRTRWKFLFIAYAHTTVFAVPYFAIAGAVDTAFIVGCLYLFSWVVFQIAVSGEVKDMAQDEANFLKALGSRVESSGDGYLVTFSPGAKLFSYASRAVTVALGIGFGHLVARRYDTAGSALAGLGVTELMLAGVGALSLVLTWSMLRNGPFNRTERIATMSKIEATSVLILLVAVVSVIGMPAAVFLFLGSGVWVMVFNKIEWGTLVAPDV